MNRPRPITNNKVNFIKVEWLFTRPALLNTLEARSLGYSTRAIYTDLHASILFSLLESSYLSSSPELLNIKLHDEETIPREDSKETLMMMNTLKDLMRSLGSQAEYSQGLRKYLHKRKHVLEQALLILGRRFSSIQEIMDNLFAQKSLILFKQEGQNIRIEEFNTVESQSKPLDTVHLYASAQGNHYILYSNSLNLLEEAVMQNNLVYRLQRQGFTIERNPQTQTTRKNQCILIEDPVEQTLQIQKQKYIIQIFDEPIELGSVTKPIIVTSQVRQVSIAENIKAPGQGAAAVGFGVNGIYDIQHPVVKVSKKDEKKEQKMREKEKERQQYHLKLCEACRGLKESKKLKNVFKCEHLYCEECASGYVQYKFSCIKCPAELR